MADHYIGCRDVKKTPRWGVFSRRPQRLCREEGSEELEPGHYIGCVIDFPKCRCMRCARDSDREDDYPCCLEYGRDCGDPSRCPGFIDENEGPVRRWLRKLFRRAGGDAPYERDGEDDV